MKKVINGYFFGGMYVVHMHRHVIPCGMLKMSHYFTNIESSIDTISFAPYQLKPSIMA